LFGTILKANHVMGSFWGKGRWREFVIMARPIWDRSARVCEIPFGPPLDSKVATPCPDFSHFVLHHAGELCIVCCRSGAPSPPPKTKNKKTKAME